MLIRLFQSWTRFYADYWRGIWSKPRQCESCARTVSWTANFCPHCGSSDITPGERQSGGLIALKLVALLIIVAANAAFIWLLYMTASVSVDVLFVALIAMLADLSNFLIKLAILVGFVAVLFGLAVMIFAAIFGPKSVESIGKMVKRGWGGLTAIRTGKAPSGNSKDGESSSKP